MMDIVAERVQAGETDEQIIAYFTSRYGDGILLDPPFEGRTLALWLLPLVALGAGIALILGRRRAPDREEADAP
jgi:cytochrome c-type biogenesis protein CcmH